MNYMLLGFRLSEGICQVNTVKAVIDKVIQVSESSLLVCFVHRTGAVSLHSAVHLFFFGAGGC